MAIRLLTVCTGNICRSPYAHLRLGHALEQVRPGAFEVMSAGTHALVGNAVDPGSVRLLDGRGIDHDTFAARQLSEQMLKTSTSSSRSRPVTSSSCGTHPATSSAPTRSRSSRGCSMPPAPASRGRSGWPGW